LNRMRFSKEQADMQVFESFGCKIAYFGLAEEERESDDGKIREICPEEVPVAFCKQRVCFEDVNRHELDWREWFIYLSLIERQELLQTGKIRGGICPEMSGRKRVVISECGVNAAV